MKKIILWIIIFLIILLILFFFMPEAMGYYAHKIVSFITFGLV